MMSNLQEEPFGTIMAIAEEMHRLAEIAVAQYTPVVEGIISSKSRDVHHIGHTLWSTCRLVFYRSFPKHRHACGVPLD
jgi:hypothetical protein